MKIRNFLTWTAAVLAFGLWLSPANALLPAPPPEAQHFAITQGKVTIQPVFCRQPCVAQSGEFTGSFDAAFIRDQIRLSNIVLKSELDFTLPEDPYTDVNGAVYDAQYYFDGRTLVLDGSVDSSAFDGPIVTYSLVAELTTQEPVGFDPTGYFLARQDYRKCAAPLCGGIYLKPVNGQPIQCPSGRFQRECYVGTPEWSKLGFNPFAEIEGDELLLKGKLFDDVKLGRFVATQAASAAGKGKKGTFYAVENNGLVCISSPCFSFDEYKLNSEKAPKAISDVDFSRTGASDKAIEIAFQLMADGEPIVIVGENRRYRGFSGVGVRLVASQFYLPVKPQPAGECPEGYSWGELGCETRNGCLFPLLEQTVYNGAPPGLDPLPPTHQCVAECEEPAVANGPGYCALYLP